MDKKLMNKGLMAGLLVTCASNALAAPLVVGAPATESSTASYDTIDFTGDHLLTVDVNTTTITSTGNITTTAANTGSITLTNGANVIAGGNIGTSALAIKSISSDTAADATFDKGTGNAYIQKVDWNSTSAGDSFKSTDGILNISGGDAGVADFTINGKVELANTTVNLEDAALLDGNNAAVTLSGTTTVDQGFSVADGVSAALTASGTANTGAITIGDGSTLALSSAADTTTIGAIDGSAVSKGTLNVTSSVETDAAIGATNKLLQVDITGGAVALTAGANISADAVNFAGDSTFNVKDAAVAANITTNTTNEGVLNFNGTGSVVGNIGGVGAVLKEVNYSGSAASMNNTILATNINVTAGTTTLTGDSAVTGIFTANGGSKFDLSSNDLTLTGAATVNGSSTLATTINSAADYGKVVASGIATIDANTVVDINVADNSALTGGETFTLVDGAGGGAVGTLSAAPTDNSNLFDFAQTVNADDLIVTSSLVADFAADTAGETTAALGTAIQTDLAAGNLSSGLANSLSTLKGLTTAQQAAALSKMTPELNGASVETAFNNQNRIFDTISNRSRAIENDRLWLTTSFTSADKDTVKGIDGYDADAKSITVGADVKKTAKSNLGVAFTYTQTDIEGKKSVNGNDTDVDSYNVTFYGAQQLDAGVKVDAQATLGKSQYDSKRDLSSIGAGVAKGDYDATTYGVAANVSKQYDVKGFAVTPVAGLAYNRISLDSYNETGSTANLNVDSESFDSLRSKVGVEVELAKLELNQNWMMKPQVKGFWSHEFMDDTYDRTAKLAGGSTKFTSKGAEPESDVFSVGAGVKLVGTNNWNVGLGYDADIASDATAHSAKLLISKKF